MSQKMYLVYNIFSCCCHWIFRYFQVEVWFIGIFFLSFPLFLIVVGALDSWKLWLNFKFATNTYLDMYSTDYCISKKYLIFNTINTWKQKVFKNNTWLKIYRKLNTFKSIDTVPILFPIPRFFGIGSVFCMYSAHPRKKQKQKG